MYISIILWILYAILRDSGIWTSAWVIYPASNMQGPQGSVKNDFQTEDCFLCKVVCVINVSSFLVPSGKLT